MRLHDHAGPRSATQLHDPGTATGDSPGKRTLTQQLGAGEGLPAVQRSQFEKSLGRDLSGVRVHTDDAAAEHADRVNARAYATGQDIVFARGEYNPFDRRSMQLLAHEVAHTAQQPGTSPSGELATTQPGDAAERNADTAAASMLAGKSAQVSVQPASVARRTKDESIDLPSAPSGSPDASGGGDGGSSDAQTRGADGASGDKKPEGEEEIGELTAERAGQEPDEGEDVGPDVPVRDIEGGKQEIAGAGQQLPPDGGAEEAAGIAVEGGDAAPATATAGDGEGGEASPEASVAITDAQNDAREAAAQAEAESAAYKADTVARREQFEAEQHALMLEQLKTMSSIEKRQTVQEMGFDPKKVKKMKDAELDALIQGKIETEQRKTKILGMTPEELAALSAGQKIQYLVDLGIDRKDLDKAGEAKAARLFDDIMKVAHVPGQHKVKIKIKGGLLGKSWEVTVKCDAEGNTDIQAQKKGGFLSKLWGWVKLALPIILTVLAPLTAGVSLIVLGVYQAAMAIKNGDWLGAVLGAVTAIGGISTFTSAIKGASAAAKAMSKVADIAKKVQKVAEAAKAAMVAAKAKNAGSLLGALAQGAAAFADLSAKYAEKFAATMKRWSERLEKWSKVIAGGQKTVQSIKKGDPLGALGGGFDAVAAMLDKSSAEKGIDKSSSVKALERASKITSHVGAGKRALESKPPNYAVVAEAALGIAGQLEQDRRFNDAAQIVARADKLKQAWEKRESDPGALVEAALGLAEAIHTAKYDFEHHEEKDENGNAKPDENRDEITKRYQRAGRIAKSASAALRAATTRPRPNYAAALDGATQLIAELTDSKKLDAAAVVTSKLDAWTRAVNAKDEKAIMAAGLALGDAINGLRDVIEKEREEAKKDAQAELPAGTTLPDEDGGALPPGPTASDLAEATATDDASLDASASATDSDGEALERRSREDQDDQGERAALNSNGSQPEVLPSRDLGTNALSPAPAVAPRTTGGPARSTTTSSATRPSEPNRESQTSADAARSVADYEARVLLRNAALREMYFQGERAIAAEVQAMLRAGQTEEAVARWSVAARNELRRAIRDQGEPIVDAVAQLKRGARDMPTYESLRARGRTDAQIIESASRSNAGVNRWVGRLRIAGRITIAIDIGIAAYNVATAADVDRPRVMATEVGRIGGALAGGAAGAVVGAKVGGAIGTFFGPGPGTAIGAGIGGVVGGIGGAIGGGMAGEAVAEWVIEEFYPPANTHFEQQ
jgi:DNA-binding phage protein